MKKTRNRTLMIILVLFLSIILARPLLAATSISATASCRMPYFVTMPDGQKVLAETENTDQDTNIAEAEENNDSFIAEDEPNLIQQQEEVVSGEDEEIQLINTVCAR
ncbi:MAG: hypothetical protein ISS45_04445 [Candidatus Omnitrophica bacterium]|nr:hypothetical protein [Candidatus Omnitrophota bacterium]